MVARIIITGDIDPQTPIRGDSTANPLLTPQPPLKKCSSFWKSEMNILVPLINTKIKFRFTGTKTNYNNQVPIYWC